MKLLRFGSCLIPFAVLAVPLSAQTNVFPASGNVGIGTTNPGARLHISGGGAGTDLLLDNNGWAGIKDSGGVVRRLWGASGDTLYFGNVDNWGSGGQTLLLANDALRFYTGGGEKVRIDAGGNVGIGTASIAGRLHVAYNNSQSQSQQAIQADGNPVLLLGQFGSAKGGTTFGVSNAGASYIASSTLGTGSPSSLLIGTVVPSPVVLGTNNVERIRIDAVGNVGIGTSSPAYQLHLYKNTNASNLIVTANPHVGAGAYTGHDVLSDTVSLSLRSYGSGFSTFSHAGVALTQAAELWADTLSGTGPQAFLIGLVNSRPLIFATGNAERLRVDGSGNVGIGTTNPTHKLAVNGTVRAKEVIVDTGWADYVFADDYRLAPLSEVEAHIKAHRTLPGVPSEATIAKEGVSMGEMQARMMAKIEELTLHVIAQEKRLNAQSERIHALEAENTQLRSH